MPIVSDMKMQADEKGADTSFYCSYFTTCKSLALITKSSPVHVLYVKEQIDVDIL